MGRKGGLDPAEAHRRAQKKKQMAKNKKQREMTREVRKMLHKPEELKRKLQGILDTEESECLNPDSKSVGISMKRQVYQKAYEASIVKQKELEFQRKREEKAGGKADARDTSRQQGDRRQQLAGGPRTGNHPRGGSQHFPPRRLAHQHSPAPPTIPAPSPAAGEKATVTLSAAPDLKIKRAEKNEKLVAMVPASLRAKQRTAISKASSKPKTNLLGLADARGEEKPKDPQGAGEGAEPKGDDESYENFMSELGGLGAFQ
ncbi:hypothetical protein HOP50_10g60710 [Chloropicon primus]|uniref:Wbp11/ELF5/Saf1 N-terminal domain-containing protein n=2 Tax=Chloropicon primus TaxID=1764295 RepID=A0A5B8MVJ3_9CHLO|nr:hypothetical protein A3770_10p60500 [Chloropicon primus]UPR02744.1 hypothetical protein HOP50_10g60710 [Chloropicon primus]|eukprot:QDZ23532.1 hypothetical protein A3770_10p60500 [Chloropicon primus]